MTQGQLDEYRALAEKHSTERSGVIVLELLDEVVRLRHLWDRNEVRRGVVSDESLMSFGEFRGERMADVPEDYLCWWIRRNNRDALKIDAEFATAPANYIAQGKLKLYDYIQRRIKQEAAETLNETMSDEEVVAYFRANGFPNATLERAQPAPGGTAGPPEGLPAGEAGELHDSGGGADDDREPDPY